MSYQWNKHLWEFFQYNSFFYMRFPELNKPELHNTVIRCSKYGWLLVSRDDWSLFFFNPFTRQTIGLPSVSDFPYITIHFFHPPTSPDCFIVGVATLLWCEEVRIGILEHGEYEWESYRYKSKNIILASISAPILHCGLLYFLDMKGNVATFDISRHGHQSCWIVNTKCLKFRPLRNNIEQHLFKIKGEEALFAAFVVHDDKKVNVFRLLEPEMKWELVKDLGDKMLYLSHTSSFGDTAYLKSMANKIYFPNFHGDNVLFYSLDTQKYHSFEGDYFYEISYGLTGSGFATWITPAPTPELSRELTWCPEGDVI